MLEEAQMNPTEKLRKRAEDIAERYLNQAGLKNDESKALFKMDVEAALIETRNEALEEAAEQV
jgi:hypothetical protein